MQRTFVATVQVLLQPATATTEAEACDYFSSLLSDNDDVLDWTYLRVGGQLLTPAETHVNLESYREGDAF